jgi:hypothetical protein
MTLIAAYMATHFERSRFWAIVGSGVAVVLALYSLAEAAAQLAEGPGGEVTLPLLGQLPHLIAQAFARNHYGLPIFANLLLVAIPIAFLAALIFYRRRGPILILLGLFLVMPVYSGLSHWYKSEQRNHWFGYWFGHDMFTPPYGIYPEMTRDPISFSAKVSSRIRASRSRTNILTGATFTSSPKMRWPIPRTWTTCGRSISVARSMTRRFSANFPNTYSAWSRKRGGKPRESRTTATTMTQTKARRPNG